VGWFVLNATACTFAALPLLLPAFYAHRHATGLVYTAAWFFTRHCRCTTAASCVVPAADWWTFCDGSDVGWFIYIMPRFYWCDCAPRNDAARAAVHSLPCTLYRTHWFYPAACTTLYAATCLLIRTCCTNGFSALYCLYVLPTPRWLIPVDAAVRYTAGWNRSPLDVARLVVIRVGDLPATAPHVPYVYRYAALGR